MKDPHTEESWSGNSVVGKSFEHKRERDGVLSLLFYQVVKNCEYFPPNDCRDNGEVPGDCGSVCDGFRWGK